MEDQLGLYALGFLGQALFGARLVVQLLLSEKEKRVVSPRIFWQLSLAASFIFLVYGILRNDAVIILGQTLSYYIYIRNLQLKRAWNILHVSWRILLLVLPGVALISVFLFGDAARSGSYDLGMLLHPVMLIGAIGQLALNLRFVYQWYFSEQEQESVLPVGFWHISTWASVLVIVYALFHPVHGIDPVLLVSQGLGIFVYIRNLVIYSRQRG